MEHDMLFVRHRWTLALVGLVCMTIAGVGLAGCKSEPRGSTPEEKTETESVTASESAEESSATAVGPDFDAVSMPEKASAPGPVAGPCYMTVDSPVGEPIEQLIAFQYEDGSLARVATIDDPVKSTEVVQCESVSAGEEAITLGSHSKPRCKGLLTSRTDYPWQEEANAVRYEMEGSISVVNTILLPTRNPAYLFGQANVSMSGDVDVEVNDGRIASLTRSEPESVALSVEYGQHGITHVRRKVDESEPKLAADMTWDEHGNLLRVRRTSSSGQESSTRLFYGCWD